MCVQHTRHSKGKVLSHGAHCCQPWTSEQNICLWCVCVPVHAHVFVHFVTKLYCSAEVKFEREPKKAQYANWLQLFTPLFPCTDVSTARRLFPALHGASGNCCLPSGEAPQAGNKRKNYCQFCFFCSKLN